jgi:hypothetical protein
MRSAIAVLLAAGGGLLALSACGLNEVAPKTTATPTTAVTATPTPSRAMTPSSAVRTTTKAPPTAEKRTITKSRAIPFETRRVNDPSLTQGTTKVRTRGVEGVKTITYEVTFTNGIQTGEKPIREVVTSEPVTQVIAVGTKQAQQCDPNYAGACVPIASDVDCAGGSGNGPAYVQGPVRVIGTDIYGLDRDGDGIGCES